jgi:membrane-bound lytic murein transglycosylase A
MAGLRPFLTTLAATALALVALAQVADAKPRKAHHGKAHHSKPSDVLTISGAQLEPLAFGQLDGWADDDHQAAFATFMASCRPIMRGAKSKTKGDKRLMYRALAGVCHKAVDDPPKDGAAARKFFEEHFRLVRINKLGDREGFITGYYEPIVEGSLHPSSVYHVPLYKRPPDLIAIGAKPGTFPNNGKVGRKNGDNEVVPYWERTEIENGILDGEKLEIGWLKDPVDAFFAQIQGSLRVNLAEGGALRLNYDAHNGHPYTPVGRVMIERKQVPREQMSMDRIREFMHADQDAGRELRRHNKSFVFFRATGLKDDQEAIGAQGIPLTARRSIAVDRHLHVYGTPFWIEAELPIATEKSETKFRHLMVAQDTGSAILGPARADFYYGAGDEAAKIAGRHKNPGRFVMLVPTAIDPVAAAREVPLPRSRPSAKEMAAYHAPEAKPAEKPKAKAHPRGKRHDG